MNEEAEKMKKDAEKRKQLRVMEELKGATFSPEIPEASVLLARKQTVAVKLEESDQGDFLAAFDKENQFTPEKGLDLSVIGKSLDGSPSSPPGSGKLQRKVAVEEEKKVDESIVPETEDVPVVDQKIELNDWDMN